jgi:hypothetical protein
MDTILLQPAELLIKQILLTETTDIKNLKLVNRQFYNFIKNHEEFLYKKKLEHRYGKWIHNSKLLFNCSEKGININDLCFLKQYDTILHYIFKGDLNVIRFLINNNIIDVNIKNSTGKFLFVSFFDELFLLESLISVDCIELFLQKQIEKEILQQAYYYACQKCDKGTIEKMINKGVNVHVRDVYGWSGQMYAILYNDDPCVIRFLSSQLTITQSDLYEILLYKTEKEIKGETLKRTVFNTEQTVMDFCSKFKMITDYQYVYFVSDCQSNLLEFIQIMVNIFESAQNTNKIHALMKICNTIDYYSKISTFTEDIKNMIFNIFLKQNLEMTDIQQHVKNSIYSDIFDKWAIGFE